MKLVCPVEDCEEEFDLNRNNNVFQDLIKVADFKKHLSRHSLDEILTALIIQYATTQGITQAKKEKS